MITALTDFNKDNDGDDDVVDDVVEHTGKLLLKRMAGGGVS